MQNRELAWWSLTLACCGLWACGGSEKAAEGYQVGDSVDIDGDGVIDGKAVDSNGDGKADGVDTDFDGVADAPLPEKAPSSDDGEADGDGDYDVVGGCQSETVASSLLAPDMLIVLDRSSSMVDGRRWDPSRNAVRDVTEELDDRINFGLMLFPGGELSGGGGWGGGGGGGGFDLVCDAGEVEVPVSESAGGEIASVLQQADVLPGTPTAASLEAALDYLGANLSAPDEYNAGKYVLLVTDGAPNCYEGQLGDGFGGGDPRAVAATIDAIEALAAAGVQTFVVGYDTQNNAELAASLDMMAVAGATGDTQHRPVEDEQSLRTMLEDIAGGAISCAFALDEVPLREDFVIVEVDGQRLNLNDPDGWILNVQGDNATVMIQGAACDVLRSDGQHTLHVEVTCDVVPPV
jgi:hypothetical protein